jgi:hypothetical protein
MEGLNAVIELLRVDFHGERSPGSGHLSHLGSGVTRRSPSSVEVRAVRAYWYRFQ